MVISQGVTDGYVCMYRLESMYTSLGVLQLLPGHSERQGQFKTLREAVMSHLRPRVQTDISNNDLHSLQEYFHIYERLGRREELEEEYVGLRAKYMGYVWDSYPTAGGNTPATTVLRAWEDWLDKLSAASVFIITRVTEDVQILFPSEEAGGEGEAGGSHSRVLCRVILEAFRELPLRVYSSLLQARAQAPVLAYRLCQLGFSRVSHLLHTVLHPHLSSPAATHNHARDCYHLYLDGYLSYTGVLSLQHPPVPTPAIAPNYYLSDWRELSLATPRRKPWGWTLYAGTCWCGVGVDWASGRMRTCLRHSFGSTSPWLLSPIHSRAGSYWRSTCGGMYGTSMAS